MNTQLTIRREQRRVGGDHRQQLALGDAVDLVEQQELGHVDLGDEIAAIYLAAYDDVIQARSGLARLNAGVDGELE